MHALIDWTRDRIKETDDWTKGFLLGCAFACFLTNLSWLVTQT